MRDSQVPTTNRAHALRSFWTRSHAYAGGTQSAREIAEAYRPIMRGLLLPVAVYYAVVFVLHFQFQSQESLVYLALLAGATAVVAVLLHWLLRKPGVPLGRLEIYSLAIYGLIYLNSLVHQLLHLEVVKLVYFVLLALAVATTGVTMRLVIAAVVVSLATPIVLAGQAGPEVQFQFAFVALASTFMAAGMSVLMRGAIERQIRARIKAEEMHGAARRAADYDFLTELPNRRHFFHRLEKAFNNPGIGGHLVLGLIDLNDFKHINDLYGHLFGDQLLANVGRRISSACSGTALVARLGGDEFALLIETPMSDDRLRELGSRICSAVGASLEIAGTEINVTAAVGFAMRLATTAEPMLLYEFADFALYRAKSVGGGRVEIFSAEDEIKLNNIKTVEHHLSVGKLESEMHVEYQPQVLVAEDRICGFEALARWHSPKLGKVPPDVFIRAAERCGVMNRITPMLLRKALADAVSWPEDIRLSFNLSARDVVSAESVDQICEIITESGFPGSRIDFEITETSIMTDFERVRDSLERLRSHGAHIALDDFGVGYSNFQHLDELAIDKIKIDRRFVSRIGSPHNSGRIARTMIEMCTNLGLTCVVEGVETATELDAILQAGGSLIQGYHFSRPMPADKVTHFLNMGFTQRLDELRDTA